LAIYASTPFFPSTNHTQPTAGFLTTDFTRISIIRMDRSSIVWKFVPDEARHELPAWRAQLQWGVEIRLNRIATIFGNEPEWPVRVWRRTAYSPVFIPSTERVTRYSARRAAAGYVDGTG